jgi:DNA-binding CsgD family transcriptional regulator
MLAQAWEQAERLDEAQRIGPAGAALVEAGWLAGQPAPAVAAVLPRYEQVRRHGSVGFRAELAYWLRRAGAPVEPERTGHPYALLAAGRWAEAARIWREAGCRYEHALALTDSDDASDVLAALATLDDLGAAPLARRTRQRLRELGVASVPRGPAPSTRDNPARLTGRQVEVVRLLAGGLTNPAIAARLVLSVRTVDAHVAAVLDKLGVTTRRDAVARARELGLLGEGAGETAGKAGGRSSS